MLIPEDAQFCPHCGRSVGPYYSYANVIPRRDSINQTILDVGRAVGSYTSLGILALLIVNSGILIWSISVILPVAANPVHGTTLYLLWPGPNPIVPLFAVNGWAFGIYHILIVAGIVASLIFMIYKSARPLRQELMLEKPEGGHSPLYRITTIFLALMTVNLIYIALILIFNVNVTTPGFSDMQLWQLLHAFAAASVWEELITRVLWLGIPLLLIDLAMHKRGPLRYYILGGSRTFGAKEMIFIWVSACVFSLGHIVYWDAFKLIPTFAAGIGLGFLFIRYGLYAAILLHFTVDYFDMPALVLNSTSLEGILGLILIALGFIGIPFLIVYLRRMILFVAGKDIKPMARRVPVPVGAGAPNASTWQSSTVPPAQSMPPPPGSFFTCAYCGWHEAKFVDGKLECTRCKRRQ